MLPELSWGHKIQDIVDYIDIYKKPLIILKKNILKK